MAEQEFFSGGWKVRVCVWWRRCSHVKVCGTRQTCCSIETASLRLTATHYLPVGPDKALKQAADVREGEIEATPEKVGPAFKANVAAALDEQKRLLALKEKFVAAFWHDHSPTDYPLLSMSMEAAKQTVNDHLIAMNATAAAFVAL